MKARSGASKQIASYAIRHIRATSMDGPRLARASCNVAT
jgi:hypothetical protein